MTDKEAIDILQNCVADYVIEDFCVGKFCPMEEDCKDKDCPYEEAIDVVVNRIKELEQIEKAHRELNGELRKELKLKDKMIDLMTRQILNYEDQLIINHFKDKEQVKEYFTKKASEKNG